MRKTFRGQNRPIIDIKEFRVNEKIFSPELVIIDEHGNNLGLMNKFKALEEARNRDLDLVEVSPKNNPPIAKFMNYGSYKYQKEKQERKNKAKQKVVEVKTIKISPRIGQHDMEVRANQAVEFINDGDKVKIEMQLRGRENQHVGVAEESIKKMVATIGEKIKKENEAHSLKIEQELTRQGSRLSIIIY